MALPHLHHRQTPTCDHKYYVRVANDTAKQRQWNSARCMERSAEAYRENYLPDDKGEKLVIRRKRLAELLHNESMMYQIELRNNSQSNPAFVHAMKDKVGYLREQKELQRKKLVAEKMKQHMRLNAPELRQVESGLLKKEVHQGWETQRSEHVQEDERRKKEKLEEVMATERAAIRYELEKQRAEEDRKEDARTQASALRHQMERLKLREEQSSILKAQEEDLILQQDEISRAEHMRQEMERKRERIQFGRILKAQALAALRRRSKQIQDELELDLKILKTLAEKEVEVKNIETSRREKAKADAKWMKQVVEEQLALERAREGELDTLYKEEAAKQWEKREAQWAREAQAREHLMREVLDGRADQLAQRQRELRLEHEESLRARETLINDMELVAQETSRQTERTAREKDERRREIDRQTTARTRAAEQQRLEAEQRSEMEKRAANEYASMIRQEAQAMTQRGYMSRGRRGAWM